jgi:HAMP domain-containing protein
MGAAAFFLFTAAMAAVSALAIIGAWRWWVHALGPVEEAMQHHEQASLSP